MMDRHGYCVLGDAPAVEAPKLALAFCGIRDPGKQACFRHALNDMAKGRHHDE